MAIIIHLFRALAVTTPGFFSPSSERLRFALFLLLIAGVLIYSDWLWRGDQVLYDMALRMNSRPPPPDVVIVAIDEASLEQTGRWPWPRSIEATLVRKLSDAGARAIVLDVLFAEHDRSDPQGDQELAQAIKHSGRVILPVVMEQARLSGQARETLPIPELAEHAILGHAHVELDFDGIARRTYLWEGLGSTHWPHLALAAARFAGPILTSNDETRAARRSASSPWVWTREAEFLIPYYGPPGHFPRISSQQILDGEFEADTFRDKMVFVGVTAAGLGDALPAPVSGYGQAMPGVEINANIYAALRAGEGIVRIEGLWRYVISAILVLMPVLILPRLRPGNTLLVTAGLILITFAACLFVLRTQGVWLPPIAILFTLACSYPIWSWRRLEFAMRYLDDELGRLRAEPGLVEVPTVLNRNKDQIQERVLAVQDATSRLRAMRRFISDSLTQMPDGVLVVDNSGSVVLSNPQAARFLHSDSEQKLAGQQLRDLLSALQYEEQQNWESVLRRVSTTTNEVQTLQGRHADGRDILVHLAPLRLADNSTHSQLVGLIVNLSDISDLKASERKRAELLGFISHDLRAPLVSTLALLELLRRGSDKVNLDNALISIEQNARHTLNLAEDFVQLARAEVLGGESRQVVDLVAVANDAMSHVWGRAVANEVRLVSSFPDVPVWVRGDPEMLARAILNLLDNAVKYGPAHSEVLLSVMQEHNNARCSVRDDGPGIDAEDIPKIFDRFQRLPQSGMARQAGAGLGLAFVKTVIDRHGGRIDVSSEPGRGTVFSLVLPVQAEQA